MESSATSSSRESSVSPRIPSASVPAIRTIVQCVGAYFPAGADQLNWEWDADPIGTAMWRTSDQDWRGGCKKQSKPGIGRWWDSFRRNSIRSIVRKWGGGMSGRDWAGRPAATAGLPIAFEPLSKGQSGSRSCEMLPNPRNSISQAANEKCQKSLFLLDFWPCFLARMTGREPATTGSTV
jgi:hypothetical protein